MTTTEKGITEQLFDKWKTIRLSWKLFSIGSILLVAGLAIEAGFLAALYATSFLIITSALFVLIGEV